VRADQRTARHRAFIAALLGLLALGGAFASPSSAFKTHPLLFGALLPSNGEEGGPYEISVNETTHHIYVGRIAVNQGHGAVYNYEPDGTLDPLTPELTGVPATVKFLGGVAVDNSGGPRDQYIYASFEKPSGVRQFDPTGAATGLQVTAASLPANGTPQENGLPPVVNGGSFAPRNVAVGPNGEVFTAEPSTNLIDEFSSSGTFIAQINDHAVFPDEHPFQVFAVGPTGNLYLGFNNHSSDSGGVYVIDATTGACLNSCVPFDHTPGSNFSASGVAVDAAGRVFIVGAENPTGSERVVSLREFQPDGTLNSNSGAEVLLAPVGLAVDESSGRVYALESANVSGAVKGMKAFGPLLILPDAHTGSPAQITSREATLNGTIGADGGDPASCHFEFVSNAAFEMTGFTDPETAPCDPAGPFSGTGTESVTANVSGLTGGTEYHLRLVGESEAGRNPGNAVTFITPGPSVVSEEATEIGETTATLAGMVNPRGAGTTIWFEYVDASQFAATGFANAVKIPQAGESVGSGTADVSVVAPLSGLVRQGEYEFRLVAENVAGISEGEPKAFATFAAPAALPDGRVYEQASPTEKNGASALGETNAVEAAAGGGGVTFFSTVGIPGGEGAQKFPMYLATRKADASGWSTQGLLPPAAKGPFAQILGWSPTLEETYESAQQIGSSAVLYRRSSADHSLAEIQQANGPQEQPFRYAGASGEGRQVLLEASTPQPLAAGAAGGVPNTYVWDKDSGEFIAAGVMNDGDAPAGGTFAASNAWFTPGFEEQSGASLFYYTEDQHAISSDGSRVVFTGAADQQVYARLNPTREQSPLDGGGHCTNPALACTVEISAPTPGVTDPNGPQPAAFVGAVPDGSKIFFLSSGKLTADATTGPRDEGRDLYRYDVESGQLTDLTPDPADAAGAEVQGLLGMSADGGYVYLAANGRLGTGSTPGNCRPGEKFGSCNLILLHEGQPTFVARMDAGVEGGAKPDVLSNWAPTEFNLFGQYVEEKSARVSADGKTLLFMGKVLGAGGRFFSELFLYRVGSSEPLCVSCSPTGEPAGSNAVMQALPERLTGPNLAHPILTRNLSASSGRVFFDSGDQLVANDHNGVNDVYEWEAEGEGSCESATANGGCLYLISSPQSTEPSYFGDADEDGSDVFFFTSQRLVGQDRDELQDVYDARIGGGIADQNPTEVIPCEGEEACRETAPAPPVAGSPGSSTFSGPGNPTPSKPKTHHKKKHHKKHKHHHKKKHHKKKRAAGKYGKGGRAR
jgi:hypothetical protein